ncbi:DUF4252 domain-containing protein [Kordia jejudonensis]|uniref:DUF4252 domain-containing protein n=1 Tax=Kordia jejudonensis TaxID=1348245 RepID=UPI0006297C4A|nr:DUF4252 domain-containing protein [Kordia jejudonensis]
MKTLQSIISALILLLCFSSCSDKESLQNYILANAENIGFSSSSIPKSVLKPIALEMNETQLEAYEAIERVNVLAYRVADGKENKYAEESKKVKQILKQQKYQELVSFGSRGMVKYIGSEDSIDEIVIFMTDKEFGFAVARIIGDDMSMNKFMELYKLVSQQNLSADGLDLGVFSNFISMPK